MVYRQYRLCFASKLLFKPHDEESPEKCFVCRSQGFLFYGIHMFRHTSVSLQLQAGISIADAAKRAGHAHPDVTLRIYSHTLKKNDLHCCEAVMKAMPKMPKREA